MKVISTNEKTETIKVRCVGNKNYRGCGKVLEVFPEDLHNIKSLVMVKCPECGIETEVKPREMTPEFYREWIRFKV